VQQHAKDRPRTSRLGESGKARSWRRRPNCYQNRLSIKRGKRLPAISDMYSTWKPTPAKRPLAIDKPRRWPVRDTARLLSSYQVTAAFACGDPGRVTVFADSRACPPGCASHGLGVLSAPGAGPSRPPPWSPASAAVQADRRQALLPGPAHQFLRRVLLGRRLLLLARHVSQCPGQHGTSPAEHQTPRAGPETPLTAQRPLPGEVREAVLACVQAASEVRLSGDIPIRLLVCITVRIAHYTE
jgi:hypothetical protein